MKTPLEVGFYDKPIPLRGTFLVFSVFFLLALYALVYTELVLVSLT